MDVLPHFHAPENCLFYEFYSIMLLDDNISSAASNMDPNIHNMLRKSVVFLEANGMDMALHIHLCLFHAIKWVSIILRRFAVVKLL